MSWVSAPADPPSAFRPTRLRRFPIGAAHYPEHVPEDLWEEDARRMREAGFNTIRLAEFAWHIMEPREGVFDFGLFDRAIALFAQHGISAILCTPTATPPRWLTFDNPEVLRVDGNGRSARHGSRQHADTCNPLYRAFSCKITNAMAEHFKDNPHVIGWQTDNELNHSESRSYSEAAKAGFRDFVVAHYGTVAALNGAWGGDVWATAYGSFDEVDLPYDAAPVAPSPTHVLDYHRYLAAATALFQSDQVEILRAANPDWFIFHNLGRRADIDLRSRFSSDLDFLGHDVYPMNQDERQRTGSHAHVQALEMDIVRGAAGNLIVPEQQTRFGSQPGYASLTPEPGEMRRMAFSSVARGADGLLFFRWRPAHFGQETYWMGLIGHDGRPTRQFDEATRFASDIARLETQILGTSVAMDVGIAGLDFTNEQAHAAQSLGLPTPDRDAMVLHRYCYRAGIACGFLHLEDALDRVRALYVPHWTCWKADWTERLRAFAENGGTVIVGALTASRDMNGHAIAETAPGFGMQTLAGVSVDGFGRIAAPDEDALPGPWSGSILTDSRPATSASRRFQIELGAADVAAGHLYEELSVDEDVEVLGRWRGRFLDGKPAITSRAIGRGRVIYVGTYLTEALTGVLFTPILQEAGVAPLVPSLPPDVEVTLRKDSEKEILFLANASSVTTTVTVPRWGDVLLNDGRFDGDSLILSGYGCAVLRRPID